MGLGAVLLIGACAWGESLLGLLVGLIGCGIIVVSGMVIGRLH